MAKKFYSDITKKIYDDEATLEAEEKKIEEKEALVAKEKEQYALERKTAANEIKEATEEVNKAYKVLQEAQTNLYNKKKDFLDKYGSYHYTTKDPEDPAFKYANTLISQTMRDFDMMFENLFRPFRRF